MGPCPRPGEIGYPHSFQGPPPLFIAVFDRLSDRCSSCRVLFTGVEQVGEDFLGMLTEQWCRPFYCGWSRRETVRRGGVFQPARYRVDDLHEKLPGTGLGGVSDVPGRHHRAHRATQRLPLMIYLFFSTGYHPVSDQLTNFLKVLLTEVLVQILLILLRLGTGDQVDKRPLLVRLIARLDHISILAGEDSHRTPPGTGIKTTLGIPLVSITVYLHPGQAQDGFLLGNIHLLAQSGHLLVIDSPHSTDSPN